MSDDDGRGDLGVGKYLNVKRRQETIAVSEKDEARKKRKVGFGNFEGW